MLFQSHELKLRSPLLQEFRPSMHLISASFWRVRCLSYRAPVDLCVSVMWVQPPGDLFPPEPLSALSVSDKQQRLTSNTLPSQSLWSRVRTCCLLLESERSFPRTYAEPGVNSNICSHPHLRTSEYSNTKQRLLLHLSPHHTNCF